MNSIEAYGQTVAIADPKRKEMNALGALELPIPSPAITPHTL